MTTFSQLRNDDYKNYSKVHTDIIKQRQRGYVFIYPTKPIFLPTGFQFSLLDSCFDHGNVSCRLLQILAYTVFCEQPIKYVSRHFEFLSLTGTSSIQLHAWSNKSRRSSSFGQSVLLIEHLMKLVGMLIIGVIDVRSTCVVAGYIGYVKAYIGPTGPNSNYIQAFML
jgi:hypothetical protein